MNVTAPNRPFLAISSAYEGWQAINESSLASFPVSMLEGSVADPLLKWGKEYLTAEPDSVSVESIEDRVAVFFFREGHAIASIELDGGFS